MDKHILAIDPGNIESAYVLLKPANFQFLRFGKLKNDDMREVIRSLRDEYDIRPLVIEGIASYGMPVGREVFDTCIWSGRYTELAVSLDIPVEYVYRKDIKLHICGQTRAKDSNIRMALIDRFAKSDLKNGKGTKANPDVFYGFSRDVWAAAAVAVYYADKLNGVHNA